MKKLAGLLLASLLMLTACGSNGGDTANEAMKIGTGIVTTESVTEATEEADGKYQVDTYFATVVLRGDKIVSMYIDTAQNSQSFDVDGNITGESVRGTKKELGDDYGMTKNPNAVAEWYKQIEALEAWTIGKTVDEVLNMKTEKGADDAHPAVPAESDLTSSVTITVHKYLEAIKVASENAVEVEGAVKVATSSITAAKADAFELNTNIATIAVDADGKVVYAFIDTMQSKATAENGTVTANGILKTKGELKDDYGMNWYEQRDAYVSWLIGKTAEEAAGQADIPSSVSISTDGFKAVVEKAFQNLVEIK